MTMRGAVIAAVGVAMVGIEFRTDAVDVLSDPLGWLLVAVGAGFLGARGCRNLAIVAAVGSVAGAVIPYQYVLVDVATGDVVQSCPLTTDCQEQIRFGDLSDPRGVALALAAVAGALALILLVRRLLVALEPLSSRTGLRLQLRMLEVVVPIWWAVPVIGVAVAALSTSDGYDPVWNGPLATVNAVRSLLLVWLAVLVLVVADVAPRDHVRESRFDLSP